jgi:hypothetical protein
MTGHRKNIIRRLIYTVEIGEIGRFTVDPELGDDAGNVGGWDACSDVLANIGVELSICSRPIRRVFVDVNAQVKPYRLWA